MWLLPKDAKKPVDKRTMDGRGMFWMKKITRQR
jgi:hypothetical protein